MQRLKLELALVLRGWAIKMAFIIFFGAGFFAIAQGVARVEREATQVAQLQEDVQQQLNYWREKARNPEFDFGSMGYYFFAPTHSPTAPWATLISGHRQDAMLQHRIRLLAITGQLYSAEIGNPNTQLLGSLDLAFVFVYLLPLLIGLLCARILAEEVHSGRWPLISALGGERVLRYRLALRFALLLFANSVLLAAGALIANINFDSEFLLIFLAIAAYQLFWFALCGFIIHWRLSSVNSYLGFIGAWLIFVFVVPGLTSLYLGSAYHTDAGTQLAIEQRQAMHSRWDEDKQAALNEFLEIYPQYADTAKLPEGFHWKWYFAMQHMSDLAVAPAAAEYRSTIAARSETYQRLMWLSPPLLLQYTLERVARADIQTQQDYLQAIEDYHGELREFYNARLFYDASITAEELADYPVFNFKPEYYAVSFIPVLLAILAGTILFFFLLPRRSSGRRSSGRYASRR